MIPTGQAEFISDGKFMALRAELQEQSMLLREILKAMQSAPAPAQAVASAKPEAKTPGSPLGPKAPAIPKEAVGKATVETVQEVDTGKTDQWGAQGAPPPKGYDAPDAAKGEDKTLTGQAEPVQMATPAPSPQDEQGAQPPAVPRRGQTETGSRGR